MKMTNEQLNELKILKDIAEILNESTDVKQMLQGTLIQLLKATQLHTGWIFLIDECGNYELMAAHNLPDGLTNHQIEPMRNGSCWCVSRYCNGKLTKATNTMECKRLDEATVHDWGETNNITHHATVPLYSGKEQFGILNVAAPGKQYFIQQELDILGAVALQIGTALKRLDLIKKEQEMRLRDERNRLAQDLHDSVNQLLFSIQLTAKAGTKIGHGASGDMFELIQQTASQAQAEMKALILQLRPDGLQQGLVCALTSYGEMIGLSVNAIREGTAFLPASVEEMLFRAGQEAMNNCRKHAGVHDVKLLLSIQKEKVTMTISDKGMGFCYEEYESAMLPTIGLKAMKQRVEKQSGTFHVTSKLGEGTTIQIAVPF